MFLLGLTGSIGIGKSTTAKMFADEGCAVWDADAAVHRLYGFGGSAVPLFEAIFPQAIVDGAVSREILKEIIAKDDTALRQIEQIVHPLVGQDRAAFLAEAQADIAVLDIPLLYETGGDARVDAVVCVSIGPELQQTRVMARETMTLAQFEAIRAKQMPNTEKTARADYVILTDTFENARSQVQEIVKDIRVRLTHA